MKEITLSFLLVLAVIYIIPIIIYGTFSRFLKLETPKGSAVKFLLGILISKVGAALAFVIIFYIGREIFSEKWLLYGIIWLGMYISGEIGQAIGPDYSWKEAIAGIVSECIYFPLSAYIVYVFINV